MMDENTINGASIQRRRQDATNSLYHNDPSSGASIATETRNKMEEEEKKLQIQISSLRRDLMIAISVPFILLLWISGTGGLFCLTFGGLVCYVLDLVESVEGTIIGLALTLIGFFGTLVFAVREFLSQSMFHFVLVPIFFTYCCFIFFSLASQFNVFMSEFDTLMGFIVQVILLCVPLVSATILTTFITLEIVDYEVNTVFSVIYFMYTWYFCRPRVVSAKEVVKTAITKNIIYRETLLISAPTQSIIYLLPIGISVLIHFSLHRNMLLTNRMRILSFSHAILVPTLLMLYCYKQHIKAIISAHVGDCGTAQGQHNASVSVARATKIFNALAFFFALTVQQHPMFDELKWFSGQREPVPTYTLLAIVLLTVIASIVQQRLQFYKSSPDDHFVMVSRDKRERWILIFRIAFDLLVGITIGLCGLLVSMPSNIIPINMVGAIALAEFHFEESWSTFTRSLLGLIGGLSVLISFVAFAKGTIYYLIYVFSWRQGISMQQFCQIVAALVALAALLPSGVSLNGGLTPSVWFAGKSDRSFESSGLASRGLIDDDFGSKDGQRNVGMAQVLVRSIFSYGLITICALSAWLELLVLEQNWTSLDIDTETVYPSYYLFISAGLLVMTCYFLHKNNAIGLTTVTIVIVVQSAKFLTLWNVKASFIATMVAMALSNLLPFLRQLSLYLTNAEELENMLSGSEAYTSNRSQQAEIHQTLLLTQNELVFYVILNAICCFLNGKNTANLLLSIVLHGDLSMDIYDYRIAGWQEALVMAGMFLGFCGSILFVFHRSAHYIRSGIFGISLLCFLFAFEGFGVLMISPQGGLRLVDANAMAVNDHESQPHDYSNFFMIMSSLMTVIAWSGFVSLQNLISCLVYSVLFGFVTTKAAMNWTFPWNPSNPFLTHTITSFPFTFLLVSKCFNTFVSLWNPTNRAYPAIFQQCSYLVAVVWPIVGLVINFSLTENDRVIRDGIIWSSLIGCFNTTLSFRAKELLNFLRKDNTATKITLITFSGNEDSSTISSGSGGLSRKKSVSMVLMTTIIVFLWAILAMILQTSVLDFDLFFPAVALLILCADSRALPYNWAPLEAWSRIAVLWWYGSVFYHILIRGYAERLAEDNSVIPPPYSLFGWDEEISIWTSQSTYLPIINLALSIVPYPAIFIGLRKQKTDTEETLFVLALLSLVAMIGGSVDCVRYLGIMGIVIGGYRCFEINRSKKVVGTGAGSDRYL